MRGYLLQFWVFFVGCFASRLQNHTEHDSQTSKHNQITLGGPLAANVRSLSAEMLALAARVAPQSGIQALARNQQVPQLVRDALNAMQAATAHKAPSRAWTPQGHLFIGTPWRVPALKYLEEKKETTHLDYSAMDIYLQESMAA